MESVSNYVHLCPFPWLVHLSLLFFYVDKNAEPSLTCPVSQYTVPLLIASNITV